LIWRMIARDRKRLAALVLILFLLAASIPNILVMSESGYKLVVEENIRLLRPTLELGVFWLDGPGYPSPSDAADRYQDLWNRLVQNYNPSNTTLERYTGAMLGLYAALLQVQEITVVPFEYEKQGDVIVIEANVDVEAGVRAERLPKSPGGHPLAKPSAYRDKGWIDMETETETRVRMVFEPYWLAAPLGDPAGLGFEMIEGGMPEPGMDPPGVALHFALADYYGVGVGDRVRIGGVEFQVTGVFEHNGRISLDPAEHVYRTDGIFVGLLAHPDDYARIFRLQADYYMTHPEEAFLSFLVVYNGFDMHVEQLQWLYEKYGSQVIIVGGTLWAFYDVNATTSLLVEYYNNSRAELQGLFPENPYATDIEQLYATINGALLYTAAGNYLLVGADFKPETVLNAPRDATFYKYFEDLAKKEVEMLLDAMMAADGEWVRDSRNLSLTLWATTGASMADYLFRVGEDVYGARYITDMGTMMSPYSLSASISFLVFPALLVLSLVVAGRTAIEAASIIVRDYRPYLAMIIARGLNPGKLKRRLGLFVIVLSLIVGLLGAVVGWQIAIHIATTTSGPRWLVGSGAIASLVIGLYISYSTFKVIREIRPVEAVRPVLSLTRAFEGYSRRVSILLALALISVVEGLLVPFGLLDRLEELSGLLAAVTAISFIAGFMMAPFAPSALAYYSSVLLQGIQRLYAATARLGSRLGGRLSFLALSSSMSLRKRMFSNVAAMSLAYGAALGAAFAHQYISDYAMTLQYYSSLGMIEPYDLRSVASVVSIQAMLPVVAVFSLGIAVIATLSSMMSTFRIVEGEVIVMRARGASKSDAARFVYGMLAPVSFYTLLVALIVSVVVAISLEGIMGFELIDLFESYGWLGLPTPRPGLLYLATLAASAVVLALAPILVSQGAIRARDIARLLRKGRFGW